MAKTKAARAAAKTKTKTKAKARRPAARTPRAGSNLPRWRARPRQDGRAPGVPRETGTIERVEGRARYCVTLEEGITSPIYSWWLEKAEG